MSRSQGLTESARLLAERLYEAEDAAELALAKVGAMMAAVPEARRHAKVAAGASHRIYAGLLASTQALSGGLGELVVVHDELKALKDSSVARTVAIGYPDKPEEGTTRPTGLRVVG